MVQLSKTTCFSGGSDSVSTDFLEAVYSSFPSLQSASVLHIPKKVQRVLERFIPKERLKAIHKDHDTAIELCLIILSNLASTFHLGRWKYLSTEIMIRQVGPTTSVYKKIIDLLKKGTEKFGPIIEVDGKDGKESYSSSGRSKRYRLADPYYAKGVETYELVTEHARKLRNKEYFRMLSAAATDPIAKNLLGFYAEVDVPTKDEVLAEAKELVSYGYCNKKNLKLTFLHGNTKERYKDASSRTFVEENLDLFESLTKSGYWVPTISGQQAGGRVSDSFTFMPSWIRSMCTVNGQRLTELDFSALHPNIAMKLYGGKSEHITHAKVAEETGIPMKSVKVEHLSFFNKRWDDMQKSPLFAYYQEREPDMMEALRQDKAQNGYKMTSQRMFTEEVKLMAATITQLNSEGIFVIYVYDALMCEAKHAERVKQAMNQMAAEANIKTTAK